MTSALPCPALPSPPFVLYPGEEEALRPRPRIRTYEWARQNMRIVSGPHKGQLWRGDLLPYARGIMDAWDAPWTRRIWICSPSQSGKTTIAYACALAAKARGAGPMGIGMPDQDTAERIMENRVLKHIELSPDLRRLLSPGRYSVQKTEVRWRDGTELYALWSGSESRMSSVSIEVLLLDEQDAYPSRQSAEIMEERCIGYQHTAKIMAFSKVRGSEGEGSIYEVMHRRAQVVHRWEAVCPACGAAQHMRFERIRVPDWARDPARILAERLARYECEHCSYQWSDHARDKALALGGWVPDRRVERPESVGFWLRSWELPFVSLSKILHDWFLAQGDPAKMQAFCNLHESVPYKTIVTATTEESVLRLVDPAMPRGVVPARADVLTLSIDMQMRDFWYSVWAHAAKPREDWLIDQGKLGDWDAVRAMLEARFLVEGSDREMGIWRACLDTGGSKEVGVRELRETDVSRTTEAYLFCQSYGRGLLHACKGASRKRDGFAVWWSDLLKLPNGKNLRGALRLHLIDTDYFKRLLMARLDEEAAWPIHLHAEAGSDYVRQLLAEELRRDSRGEFWHQVRRNNHWLDCAVMHLAMTHMQWMPNLDMTAARRKQRAPAEEPAGNQQGGGWIGSTGSWMNTGNWIGGR